jgi:hypothetical protein
LKGKNEVVDNKKYEGSDYFRWCQNLTELVYEYERQTKKLPSKTTVRELMKWVKEKADG